MQSLSKVLEVKALTYELDGNSFQPITDEESNQGVSQPSFEPKMPMCFHRTTHWSSLWVLSIRTPPFHSRHPVLLYAVFPENLTQALIAALPLLSLGLSAEAPAGWIFQNVL